MAGTVDYWSAKPKRRPQEQEKPGKASTPLAGPSGRWSDYYRGSANPAAPLGAAGADRFSPAPTQVWLSGQNSTGGQNGFDTVFYDKFVSGYSAAQAKGEGADYFAKKNTGVALWDDPDGRFRFGDTFVDNRSYGNLYTQLGQDQANLLMGKLVLGRNIGRYDNPQKLDQAIQQFRTKARHEAEDANTFKDYEKLVDKKASTIDDWEVQLAGAGQGLLTWGGVGALGGGWGMAIGGVAGGIAGLIGASNNMDPLRRQMAEQMVQADLAAARMDPTDSQWFDDAIKLSKYGMAYSRAGGSTVGNLIDSIQSNTGPTPVDGVADLAASFVDAAARSASIPARTVFQTEMMLGGSLGAVELAATGGEAFDTRAGRYRNVFVDRDTGEATLGSVLRGSLYATSPLVDVAQGAAIGGLARGLKSAASAEGTAVSKVDKFLPQSMRSGNTYLGSEGGRAWFRNADGVVQGRLSPSVLAPSEMLAGMTAGAKARIKLGPSASRAALKSEMYRQLRNQTGASGLVVNAVGEGFEEAYQSIAEQVGLGHTLDFSAIRASFLEGAAMGAGMHVGAALAAGAQGTREARTTRIASEKYEAVMGTPMPDTLTPDVIAEFASYTQAQVESARSFVGSRLQGIADTTKGVLDETMTELITARAMAVARLNETSEETNQLFTDNTGMITQLDSTINAHNAEASTEAVLSDYTMHRDGLGQQTAVQERKFLAGQITENQKNERVALAETAIKYLNTRILPLLRQAEDARVAFMRAKGTTDEAAAYQHLKTSVDKANKVVKAMWNAPRTALLTQDPAKRAKLEAAAPANVLAASLIFHRAPKDNKGSMQAFRGLISIDMSTAHKGKGTGLLRRVGTAILQQMAGDYDGDLFKQSNQILLDVDTLRSMRSGPGRWSSGMVEVGEDGTETYKDSKPTIAIQYNTEAKAIAVSQLFSGADAFPLTNKASRGQLLKLRRSLRYMLTHNGEIIAAKQINELIKSLTKPMGAGATPIADFFDTLGSERVGLDAISWARWADILGDIAVSIERTLDTISTQRAAELAVNLDSGGTPNPTGAAPVLKPPPKVVHQLAEVEQTPIDSRGEQEQAATTLMTRSGLAGVSDSYRDATGGHYTLLTSPELKGATANTLLAELDKYYQIAKLVRRAQSGETRSDAEPTTLGDRIIAKVQDRLIVRAKEAKLDGPSWENAVLAGMTPAGDGSHLRALDFEWRAAIAEEVREAMTAVRGLPTEDAVVSSLLKLSRSSTSEVLLQTFGGPIAQYMSADDASALGRPNASASQLAKNLALTPQWQVFTEGAWKQHEKWSNKIGRYEQNKLRSVEEVAELSTYQIFAEAIIDVANHIAPKQREASSRYDKKLSTAAGQLLEVIRISANKMPITTRKQLGLHLSQMPGQLTNLLRGSMTDEAIARLGVYQDDGTVEYRTWLLDAILHGDPEELVNRIWAHDLLDRMSVVDEHTPLEDITDLRVRYIYNAMQESGEADKALVELRNLLSRADRHTVVTFLNDYFVGDAGPKVTLWANDIRSYDPDSTSGGWKTPESLSERSEWLDKLSRTAMSVQDGAFREIRTAMQQTDEEVLTGMEDPNSRYALTFKKNLDFIARYGRGLSTQAQIDMHTDLLWGTPAGMAAKGAAISATELYGRTEANKQALLYGDTVEIGIWQSLYGRVDSIVNNPSLLAGQTSGTFLDANHNLVSWSLPDHKRFAELWRGQEGMSPASLQKTRALLMNLMFTGAVTEGPGAMPVYGFDTLNLTEMMSDQFLHDRLFGSTAVPRKEADMLPPLGTDQAAALFAAADHVTQGKASQALQALLIAQTSKDKFYESSEEGRRSRVAKAMRDMAQIWVQLASMPERSWQDNQYVNTLEYLRLLTARARQTEFRERVAFGNKEGYKAALEMLQDLFHKQTLETSNASIQMVAATSSSVKKIYEDADAAYRSAYEQWEKNPTRATEKTKNRAERDRDVAWGNMGDTNPAIKQAYLNEIDRLSEVERMLSEVRSGSMTEKISLRYKINNPPTAEDKLRMHEMILAHPDAQSHMMFADREILRLVGSDPSQLDDKLTELISEAMTDWAWEQVSAGGALPGDHRIDSKHKVQGTLLAQDWAYLEDLVFDSSLVSAFRELGAEFNRQAPSNAPVTAEWLYRAVDKLLSVKNFGRWTSDYARVTQQNMGWVNASDDPVRRSGSVLHREAPLDGVTPFEFHRIDTTVAGNLVSLDLDADTVDEGFSKAYLDGRFVQTAEVFDVDVATGTEISMGNIPLDLDGIQRLSSIVHSDPNLWALDGKRLLSAYRRWVGKTKQPAVQTPNRRIVRVSYVPTTAQAPAWAGAEGQELNIYRRGINTTQDAAKASSNIGGFLSALGGPGQEGVTHTFAAAKTGAPSIRTLFGDGAEKTKELEALHQPELGGQNMTAFLNELTSWMINRTYGSKKLSHEWFVGLREYLGMHMAIRYVDSGGEAHLIAGSRTEQALPAGATFANLVKLPPETVLDFIGVTMPVGGNTPFPGARYDLTALDNFTGEYAVPSGTGLLQHNASGWAPAVDMFATVDDGMGVQVLAAAINMPQQHVVPRGENLRTRRVQESPIYSESQVNHAAEVHRARVEDDRENAKAGETGSRFSAAIDAGLQDHRKQLFLSMRVEDEIKAMRWALNEAPILFSQQAAATTFAIQARHKPNSTLFTFSRQPQDALPDLGWRYVSSLSDMKSRRKAEQATAGDLGVFKLGSWVVDGKPLVGELHTLLSEAVARGLTIMLDDADTNPQLRVYAETVLKGQRYGEVGRGLWAPSALGQEALNVKSRISLNTKRGPVSGTNLMVVIYNDFFHEDEGGAHILTGPDGLPHTTKMSATDIIGGESRTFFFGGEDESNRILAAHQSRIAEIARVDDNLHDYTDELLQSMKKYYDPEGKKGYKWGTKSKEHRELFDALKAWARQADPAFPRTKHNIGSLIPLVDTKTGQILFLRVGMKAPTAHELAAMTANRVEDQVLVFMPEREESATAREMENVSYFPGLDGRVRARGTITIGASGKFLHGVTGIKTTLSPARPGTAIADVFTGLPNTISVGLEMGFGKSRPPERMDVARNMIKYLGYDQATFMAALGNDIDPSAVTENQAAEMASILRKVFEEAQKNKWSEEAVDQTIRSLPAYAGIDGENVLERIKLSTPIPYSNPDFNLMLLSVYTYWRMSGAGFQDIVHSNSLSSPEVQSGLANLWEVPNTWAQLFDRLPANSTLKTKFTHYMNMAVNQSLPNFRAWLTSDGNDGFSWYAHAIKVDDAGKQHRVVIRILPVPTDVRSAGDDAQITQLANDRKLKQGISKQGQSYATAEYGTSEATRVGESGLNLKDITRGDQSRRVLEGINPAEDAVTQMFAEFDRMSKMQGKTRLRVKSEGEVRNNKLRLAEYHAFHVPLNFKKLEDDANLPLIKRQIQELATMLSLKGSEVDAIHTLVRQSIYAPGPLYAIGQTDADENAGAISSERILDTLAALKRNVAAGNLPTSGLLIPVVAYDALTVLHRASMRSKQYWLKWEDGQPVTDFDDWVYLSLGLQDAPGQVYNKALLPGIDAMVLSYSGHEGLEDMLGSTDNARGEALAGVTLEHILVSWDNDRRHELLHMPVTGTQATVGEILQARYYKGQWASERPDQSLVDTELNRIWATQRKAGKPAAVTTTTRETRDRGRVGIMQSVYDRGAYAMFKEWRTALPLLHPGMLIASPAEYAQVTARNNIAQLVNGSSIGALSKAVAFVREQISGTEGVNKAVMSLNDINTAQQVASATGKNVGGEHYKLFADEMKGDTPLSPYSLMKRFTTKAVRKGTRWQDAMLGRSYESYIKTYLTGLYENIARDTTNNWSLEDIALRFAADPGYFKREDAMFKGAHKRSMNMVRSTKGANQTVGNMLFRYHLDKAEHSERALIRWPTRFTIGPSSVFSGYGFSRLEALTGTEFIGALAALNMHGRKYGQLSKRYDQFFSWVTKTDPRPPKTEAGADAAWDMNEILETLDLSLAFAKSGTTWASYFILASVLKELNLTGSDDEDRNRRRQGKAAGNVHLYDPRDVANDFRNMDAIYLDSIPWLSDLYRMAITSGDGESRSMLELNWIMKSLWSPLLGFTRFDDNGNPYEILWGFQDALRSMPLINTMYMWDMSDVSASLIEAHSDSGDGAEAMDATTQVMVRLVMNLERMLLESAFINEIYKASDKYDRDPYKIARRGENDRVGAVLPTEALQTHIDDTTGDIRKHYVTRNDPWFAYAENRAAWALLLAPFTGGESIRHNMVVKTRSIDKGSTVEDARAVVMDLFNKDYLSYDEQQAVIWGLWKGSVRIDSPALDGFYMSYQTRYQLTDELQAYLKEDGLAMGLSEAAATRRANLLWWGDSQNPGMFTPLNEIVWSDAISKDPTIEYRQLNTSYVMGPDGRPWATGISRDLAGTLASQIGAIPGQGYNSGTFAGMNSDALLNSVDPTIELNTGMRSLERVDSSWSYATEEPLLQQGATQGYYPFSGYRRGGWGRRSGWGRGGGGGGGRGGFAPRATYSWIDRWYAPNAKLPNEIRTYVPPTPNVYSNTNINTGNVSIRRGSRRRERVNTQRGRLKPWQ